MYEVVEAGFAAVGPVFYVVSVDEMAVGAAWEAAVFVSGAESAAYGWGDGAGFAGYAQGLALLVFDDAYCRTIAGYSA